LDYAIIGAAIHPKTLAAAKANVRKGLEPALGTVCCPEVLELDV